MYIISRISKSSQKLIMKSLEELPYLEEGFSRCVVLNIEIALSRKVSVSYELDSYGVSLTTSPTKIRSNGDLEDEDDISAIPVKTTTGEEKYVND
jgi:hypothetical protein